MDCDRNFFAALAALDVGAGEADAEERSEAGEAERDFSPGGIGRFFASEACSLSLAGFMTQESRLGSN